MWDYSCDYLLFILFRINVRKMIGSEGFGRGYRGTCRLGGGYFLKQIGDVVGIHSLGVCVRGGFFTTSLAKLNPEFVPCDGEFVIGKQSCSANPVAVYSCPIGAAKIPKEQ